jgi:hypothetical protein
MGHTHAFTVRDLARELSVIAHARALHAVYPILRLGAPRHRDIVYRCLAEEFRDLESSVEDLLRRSEIAPIPKMRRPPPEPG